MRFLSIAKLKSGILQLLTRFPIEVLIVIFSLIVAIQGIEKDQHEEVYIRILMSCNLGLLLTLATDIYTEEANFTKSKKWIFRLVALGLSFLLYTFLDLSKLDVNRYRICAFSIAFHLLVSMAPFLRSRGSSQDFWEYNKALFLRMLTSVLYSGVLYAGIALALGAVENLWQIHINSKTYFEVFATIGILFNSLFFMAGIPTIFHSNDRKADYPKGLKVFTQFILIPLMSIYMIILALYEVKIILANELPRGTVVWMVIGYAFFGILSLLLVYPIKSLKENKWINIFSRVFYIALIPFIVLLFIAIGIRIKNYGVTEERYSIVAIGIWLLFLTIVLLLKPNAIKIIPLSLCIIALLATYGPQSAPSISLHSQLKQLKNYIKNGQKKGENAESIVQYIIETHGLNALQPLTNRNLKQLNIVLSKSELKYDNRYYYNRVATDSMKNILKIKDYNYYDDNLNYVSIYSEEENVYSIKGYDYIINMDNRYDTLSVKIENKNYTIDPRNNQFEISNSNKQKIKYPTDSIVNIFKSEIKNKTLKANYSHSNSFTLPQKRLIISLKMDQYIWEMYINGMSFSMENNSKNEYSNLRVFLLIKKVE